MLNLKVIVENKTYKDGFIAEHGLCLYLKTEEMTLLYDTGATDLLIHNAKQMGIELDKVDAVVISHGHYDHTGGLPSFTENNKLAPIYIHKEAFHEFYGLENGLPEKETCGIRWSDAESQRLHDSGRLNLTEGVLWLTKNIVISGTIPLAEGFEQSEQFYIKDNNGELIPDNMAHEQFLAVRDGGGIHIISGCSHTGATSCVQYAKKLFPGEKVLSLTGGFHLYSASERVREKAISQLLDENINRLIPFHCTGMKATCDISAKIGDKCTLVGAGDEIHLR